MTHTTDKLEDDVKLNEKPVYEKPVLTNLYADKTAVGPTAGAENGFSSS